jgi:hypothetical protein
MKNVYLATATFGPALAGALILWYGIGEFTG